MLKETPASPGVFIINVFFPHITRFIRIPDLNLAASLNALNSPLFEVSFTGRTVGGGGLRRRCDGAGVAPVMVAGGMSGQRRHAEPLGPSVPPLASSYHRFKH